MTSEGRPPPPGAPLEPDPMLGRTLAERYRIDALVARGGMARVYRAHDDRLDRDVAVKVLAPPYSDDAAFSERFLGEARAAASISHPSLVHVYDSGTDQAAHYIVMELLDRHRTLREILGERGSLPVGEVLRIGRELLAGLRVVHERGLVHCDVKAANVMLGPGPAKLIDFGIAQPPHEALEGDTSIGTLQAMSPEQLHGEALTAASDLFSLGTVLYEALTGRVAYPGGTPAEVAAAHAAGAPVPPSTIVPGLPARLDAVVLQTLRHEPQARFHSATAMTRALEGAIGEGSAAHDDETRIIRSPAVGGPPDTPRPDAAQPERGYVPPPVSDVRPPASPAPGRAPRRPRASIRQPSSRWGIVGTLLVLGAAALVVVLVVVPLLELGGSGGNGEGVSSPSPPPPAASAAPDIIPDTIGLPTDEAIAVARAAGLDWTVRCNQDPERPEGIVDQEPPAGTEVAPGSAFTMFSARIQDCR